ncbi:MAG: carotenoid biosynthesis protein [Anaerolineae bacterium]
MPQELIDALLGLPRMAQALLLLWMLEMISVPILKWIWGTRAERTGIVLGVLLQFAAVMAVLATAWRPLRLLATVGGVAALAWLVEFVGSQTGAPFGRYHYTDRLQPQLQGVPLLIPLAWLMMLPPAWAVGARLASGGRIATALVAGLAFTAWDLFLDPQMVRWHFWQWEQPGGYVGIPWVNFLGWFAASAAMTALIGPDALPVAPLLFIYAVTWALESIGQAVFWNLRTSAVVGFIGMGLFVVLAVT